MDTQKNLLILPGESMNDKPEDLGRFPEIFRQTQMAVCQNLVPLVNLKIAGKWMFIPLKMVLIGIDPYPNPKYHSDGRVRSDILPTELGGWSVCR